MLKLCDPAVAEACWYCSRFGPRLLPIDLQRHFLPLYPVVGDDGKLVPFAKRWADTLAGNGAAYISDESLMSRIVATAFSSTDASELSDALVTSLAKETLLSEASIRELYKKHREQSQQTARWDAPHATANDDGAPATVDNGIRAYDSALVGRRCTLLWSPPDGEDGDEGYYAATLVAYNPRAAAHKGRFLAHFDDGQRERIDLPDETVRVMTTRVAVCRCKDSPGGARGCCHGVLGGSESLPRPWEADPK